MPSGEICEIVPGARSGDTAGDLVRNDKLRGPSRFTKYDSGAGDGVYSIVCSAPMQAHTPASGSSAVHETASGDATREKKKKKKPGHLLDKKTLGIWILCN
ncbi:hypothetical protein EYF80_021078 [Liparis tanakae]|uniref:Uncharacterized protein n=1 Tax=Liparis tanakae TaxID=230148 RepID=A0A4Z2HS50_9TELE|nr:hypothetical protein EYF80_021078 [Liparis tanakae]